MSRFRSPTKTKAGTSESFVNKTEIKTEYLLIRVLLPIYRAGFFLTTGGLIEVGFLLDFHAIQLVKLRRAPWHRENGLKPQTGKFIMNKHQLIQAIKESQDLSTLEAAKCVDLFFEAMADALSRGGRVEIRGLCSFQVRQYPSYTGRNPKTGNEVTVTAKKLPVLKVGTELRRRVDG